MRKSQIILCIRLNGIVEDFLENNDLQLLFRSSVYDV